MKVAIAGGELTQDRLLQLAFLAPQWAKFIENYFNWPGLVEGLCWYLAHMTYVWGKTESAAEAAGFTEIEEPADDGNSEERKKTTTGWDRYIRERTPLSNHERQEGAVDVSWFQKTYATLKAERWQALATAARFAANPAQAKKAQFVGDVLLGKVSRKELINGIVKKYLKDSFAYWACSLCYRPETRTRFGRTVQSPPGIPALRQRPECHEQRRSCQGC